MIEEIMSLVNIDSLKPPIDTREVVAGHAGVVVARLGIAEGDRIHGKHGRVVGVGKVVYPCE